MPLMVVSASDAFKRLRLKDARWPRTPETQADRLIPLAQPKFWPSFYINRSELIFTIGSCFARNIEKQLITEGYRVAAADFEVPIDHRFKADPDAVMNRYVVPSIANELHWGFGIKRFKMRNLVYLGEDQWFDPHVHPLVAPGPLDMVMARRDAISSYMAKAKEARVIIMTLGLAEAWFDTQSGLYLNAVPPTPARQAYPDRFEFHLLDYNTIHERLEHIHNLLTKHGRKDFRILVTVSPVAMNTTFTGGDVLVANTYSKAVQRAAVEAFVRAHDNVDYFPSFESVMLSDRRRAWRDDQAHASDEIVRLNVLRMIQAYADPDESPDDLQALRATEAFALVQNAREAAGLDAPDEAIAAYRAAIEAAPQEALILLEFGRFLYEQRQNDEAARMIEASTRHGSGSYGGFYYLAQVYFASHRLEEAYDAAARAREHQPTRPGVIDLSANIARRLGRLEEAVALLKVHLELDPSSDASREKLEALHRQIKEQKRDQPEGRRDAVKALLGPVAIRPKRLRR